jgi:acetylornithine deacetylase
MSRGNDSLTRNAVKLLERLVAFDSVSRNSNLPIIAYIEKYLSKYGISYKRIYSVDKKKCNLLARIGPNVAGGMVLSGHTDVVPIDGQKWNSDPFKLTRRGSKYYGRGAADMKAFVAVSLAMVPELLKLKLKKPVWLAFSYDEEVGCLGAPRLLDYIVKNIPKPAFAIVGEPTLMKVVTAHKGVLSFETTVHGLEGHSSRPHAGVNAVQVACELVSFLSVMAMECARSGVQDERFDPPYTTVHVGTIRGGTARNIIPKECSFQWEIRPLPGDKPDMLVKRFESFCAEIRKMMKSVSKQADIVTRPMSRMTGVTLPSSAEDDCRTVMRCAQTNQEQAVSFCTEAGIFNEHGVPAIICGPGSIEQAHKPNEFIEQAQIRKCVEFLMRLADEL